MTNLAGEQGIFLTRRGPSTVLHGFNKCCHLSSTYSNSICTSFCPFSKLWVTCFILLFILLKIIGGEREGVGGNGRGGGMGGVMTQSLYAHMNKGNKKNYAFFLFCDTGV
jgi:hypothetical protein